MIFLTMNALIEFQVVEEDPEPELYCELEEMLNKGGNAKRARSNTSGG